MSWQSDVESEAERLGLRKTSGYRSPSRERALGGPASSFHSRGTPEAPGAIDIGGSASKLKVLFDEIRLAFAGRIAELYLNLPGGTSEDIKNNQTLSRNPEAGRPQHLHVAINPSVDYGGRRPAAAIPEENRGAKGVKAVPTDELAPQVTCERKLCGPTLYPGMEPQCYCWSDLWVYGAAVGLILGGFWLTFRGKG